MDFSLSAVHVHHGLSVNADAWALHCESVCGRLDVSLAVHRVTVRLDGHGLEGAARAARHRVFAAQECDFLVLAHHRDDQAETLLFRLLRGAGAHGLAAMAEQGRFGERDILRPLLGVSRAELHDWACARKLAWIDDESNADLELTRNWLRHEAIPLLETRFPAGRAVLARTAGQLAESAALLDDLAAIDCAEVAEAGGLRIAGLAGLSPARAANLLRYWLRRAIGVSPGQAWTGEALRQLLQARPDHHPDLDVGVHGWRLRRRGGLAVLETV